jgi:hypothetical protein
MIPSKRITPSISEEEIDITQFQGLNTFGPHADLPRNQQRVLDNFDNYGTYIKSRRGSEQLISAILDNADNLAHTVFPTVDKDYLVLQIVSGSNSIFKFIALESGGLWKTVLHKTSGLTYTITGSTAKADMMVSNGKVYIFHETENSIFEFNENTNLFERRKLGLPAPQIKQIITESSGTLDGKRVYGVELVYKDTSVTPNVPLIVSGPNRALAGVTGTDILQNEGALAWTEEGGPLDFRVEVVATLNDGSLLEDTENDNWTHIRLYRSRDVTTATNAAADFDGDSEITGYFDELYQVQEMTRAAFLATKSGTGVNAVYNFASDSILDDDIPFPLDLVTDSRMELYPVPPATTGTFINNRVFASGIVAFPGPSGPLEMPNIESKIFYTPETDTIYSENMSSIHTLDSDPGDGQKMIKLIPLKEDLIGLKQGKTGRVRNANPELGWTTEDETIGILDKELAQFVPNVGICAIVNDQNDFRIFGYDLVWKSTFAGMQISRPIREEIKQFTTADIDFIYINGKLIINGGQGTMLVLATEQQSGWSKYIYNTSGLSETVFVFQEGTRAAMVSRGQGVIEIEKEDGSGNFINTDYDPVSGQALNIDLTIDTWKFQDREGRSLVEERILSIVAAATSQLKATAFVNGKQWAAQFPLILDPADYPDLVLKETEYQGYEEYRAVGNYIHYSIVTSAPCTIYSIMLNCQIQRGSIRPGFDPFQILLNARTSPPWASMQGVITETGDPTDDTITETGDSGDDTITETGD